MTFDLIVTLLPIQAKAISTFLYVRQVTTESARLRLEDNEEREQGKLVTNLRSF